MNARRSKAYPVTVESAGEVDTLSEDGLDDGISPCLDGVAPTEAQLRRERIAITAWYEAQSDDLPDDGDTDDWLDAEGEIGETRYAYQEASAWKTEQR